MSTLLEKTGWLARWDDYNQVGLEDRKGGSVTQRHQYVCEQSINTGTGTNGGGGVSRQKSAVAAEVRPTGGGLLGFGLRVAVRITPLKFMIK
jgi:hypothetical protein